MEKYPSKNVSRYYHMARTSPGLLSQNVYFLQRVNNFELISKKVKELSQFRKCREATLLGTL